MFKTDILKNLKARIQVKQFEKDVVFPIKSAMLYFLI